MTPREFGATMGAGILVYAPLAVFLILTQNASDLIRNLAWIAFCLWGLFMVALIIFSECRAWGEVLEEDDRLQYGRKSAYWREEDEVTYLAETGEDPYEETA